MKIVNDILNEVLESKGSESKVKIDVTRRRDMMLDLKILIDDIDTLYIVCEDAHELEKTLKSIVEKLEKAGFKFDNFNNLVEITL